MTEGRLRRIHWVVGIGALLAFVTSGAYMRWMHQPPVEELADASRALYRSRHIFLLLVAVANLARAAGLSPSKTPVNGAMLVASLILGVAPMLLVAAFAVEPPLGIDGRTYSTPALYSLFGAALIFAFQGRR
jgi:hypothetical protein